MSTTDATAHISWSAGPSLQLRPEWRTTESLLDFRLVTLDLSFFPFQFLRVISVPCCLIRFYRD